MIYRLIAYGVSHDFVFSQILVADMAEQIETESLISYPSYKSFDDFIDVEKLKSLDGYISERLTNRVQLHNDLEFYTGPYRLNKSAPDRPGSRMVYLSQSKQPDSYFDLDRADLWQPTDATAEFSLLMDFISTLPFESTGRMLIMYDNFGRPVSAHRDHADVTICHEFIWFRTNLTKPFYLLNPTTDERLYVEGYSAWFDTVNQFHGSDASEGLSFSIRVDGTFTKEFRKNIPFAGLLNRAASPSAWAADTSHHRAHSVRV